MTKATKGQQQTRTPSRAARRKIGAKAAIAPRVPTPDAERSPGGKLGLILQRLGEEGGVTLEDLVAATAWQSHTVRAAVCRLRKRGYGISLDKRDGRKAYRLLAASA